MAKSRRERISDLIVEHNQPCLSCSSSDARQVYSSGSSYCFSCKKYFPKEGSVKSDDKTKTLKESNDETFEDVIETKKDDTSKLEEILTYPVRGFKERKISKAACEFFGVRVTYDSAGNIAEHYYKYEGGYKVRKLPKKFHFVGKFGGVFGQGLFPGGGKRIVITEGELDALSVAEASLEKYQKIYPVVSLPSSAATSEVLPLREWFRSFKEIVLFLDDDEPGHEAASKLIRILGVDKCKIVKLPPDCKDASDVLVKLGVTAVNQCIWDAEAFKPAGIISKEAIWEQIVARNKIPSVPYPDCLDGINSKIKGMRAGEITLLISGTGCGKSTIVREVVLSRLERTSGKIGIISLEESPGETGMKLASMKIRRNPANEDISDEDLKIGFDEVFGDDRIVVLDHQGSIKDESIIDQLEYMCLMGCDALVVDHITILVSEGSDGLTGNEAIDKIMNDLLRVVKKHNVWLGLVSHLRKVSVGGKSFEEGKLPSMDDIRGSGSIKQVSMDIIAFARNLTAIDPVERNTIQMSVLKSRTVGITGRVAGCVYHQETGRLTSVSLDEFEEL